MSIFGIFRVMAGTYTLAVSTISNPFTGSKEFLEEKSISMTRITRDTIRALPWVRKVKPIMLKAEKLLLFQTSSPSSKVSYQGALIDLKGLKELGLYEPMLRWFSITRSPLAEHFVNILEKCLPKYPDTIPSTTEKVCYILDKNQAYGLNNPFITQYVIEDIKSMNKDLKVLFITKPSTAREISAATVNISTWGPHFYKNETAVGQVGQLQFVKEAAGKLRAFAMVDVWTQSLMQPLHKLLTSFLRDLPNDGTLNQTLSYERARDKSIIYGCSYGYDLSAATDRLPITYQVRVLRGLFEAIGIPTEQSLELSNLWKQILVGRPFLIPKLQKGVLDPQELSLSSIYYEVGQPMGALSSFNMLALTHHMIVQDCAQHLGHKGWCELYELTGDDIVIFDAQIAAYYVEYMGRLGLELNQKKSVVSIQKAAGEYLKKTWIKNIDVSMISWKQLYQNHSTLMGRVSDALYFLEKWRTHGNSIPAIVRRCVLNWNSLNKNSREDINVPLLALLSTALRQSKLPLEKFFLFLMGQRERSLNFKDLYSKLSKLKVKQEEITFFLDLFFNKKEITFPFTRDWHNREIAFSSVLLGLRKSLIVKIMELHDKLHGTKLVEGKMVRDHTDHVAYSDREGNLPDIFAKGAKMSSGFKPNIGNYGHAQAGTLFGTPWVMEQVNLLVDSFKSADIASLPKTPAKPGGWSYDQRWVVGELVVNCILNPAVVGYIRQVAKLFPKLNPTMPSVTEADLQNLSLEDLLRFLDLLVNFETMLTTHKVKDMDRKISHKASLSILSKIKPHKSVDPENFGFMGLGFGSGMGLGGGLSLGTKDKPKKAKPKAPGDWLFSF